MIAADRRAFNLVSKLLANLGAPERTKMVHFGDDRPDRLGLSPQSLGLASAGLGL